MARWFSNVPLEDDKMSAYRKVTVLDAAYAPRSNLPAFLLDYKGSLTPDADAAIIYILYITSSWTTGVLGVLKWISRSFLSELGWNLCPHIYGLVYKPIRGGWRRIVRLCSFYTEVEAIIFFYRGVKDVPNSPRSLMQFRLHVPNVTLP